MDPSRSAVLTDEILEDCLQAVHRLEEVGRPPDLGRVASFARIATSTAMDALRELEARGLVRNGQPGNAILTGEGRRQAAGIVRRHRLSERLFADILGLSWDRVHDEAMRLEHALTPEAETRLDALLNHPETCPHGGPIPTPEGTAAVRPASPLDQAPPRTRVRVQRIVEEEAAFLRYLASLGLLPGVEIRVEEVAPLGGPLLIQVGDARYALGRDVAARILVRQDEEPGGPRRPRSRKRRGRSVFGGGRTGRGV